ncbi:MAG: phospholipase D family protein [Myxococcaceae bacterium]|nr:phospholipase D family protein [Myxococcaceae bacterium]
MRTRLIQQPYDLHGNPCRFGDVLQAQFSSGLYTQAFLCAAYATTSGTSRIARTLRAFTAAGHPVEVLVGLGNGTTSAQAIDQLLQVGATVHGLAIGADVLFHSKVYLLEGPGRAWLAVGSCNLTADGLYRNFETMTVLELDLSMALDQAQAAEVKAWQSQLQAYRSNYIALARPMLRHAVAQGLLLDETAAARAHRAVAAQARRMRQSGVPAIRVPQPPAPAPGFARPQRLRPTRAARATGGLAPAAGRPLRGALVWEKSDLPDSDALRTRAGSSHVGGLRLTQAGFQVQGQTIDQTTYFRNTLFGAAPWSRPHRPRTRVRQEETVVPFDTTILGHHLGVQHLQLSHKPSGEAGQGNYTTIIHWGPLARMLRTSLDIRGRTARLYAPPPGASTPFSLEIR